MPKTQTYAIAAALVFLSSPVLAAQKCGTVEHIFNNSTFKGVRIAIEDVCFDGDALAKPVELSDLSGRTLNPNKKSRRVEPFKDSNGNLVGFAFHFVWGHGQVDVYRFDPKRVRYGKIKVMTNHRDKVSGNAGKWGGWQDLSKQGGNHFRFTKN